MGTILEERLIPGSRSSLRASLTRAYDIYLLRRLPV